MNSTPSNPVQSCQPSCEPALLLRRLETAQNDCMAEGQAAAAILLQDARAALVSLATAHNSDAARLVRATTLINDGSDALEKLIKAEARIETLEVALREISTHWAIEYDHPRKENEMYRGPYGIGVTDGHRACKIIADRALEAK